MSEHKGQEQHEIEDIISDVVDHISNLPHCILEHILSFMPTKEVVQTSVLSTRWKNLWASVPNIDFDDILFMTYKEVDGKLQPDLTSFVEFVQRALRLRDASNMDKFRLSCRLFRAVSQIHSWISDAILHNVRELDLDLSSFLKDPSVIPRSMFDGTSLVTLKIRMDCAIELPSHVSFPCLKTFHLSYVRFPTDDFTEKLISGCPVLEELVLVDCMWIHLKNISISSSTLKSLTISDSGCDMDMPCYRECGFGHLIGSKIKIDATNLTYFEYLGCLSNEIILHNTSSLDKTFIHNPGFVKGVHACRAIDLLQQLKYVVSLRLSDYTLKGFTRMHLGENNLLWSSIPIHISNCLKTVVFKNFHPYDSNICFLKCVLKTVCTLERIDILWSKTKTKTEVYGVKRKTEVMKELEKIETRSTTCVINFS